jgi:hypothetical protein
MENAPRHIGLYAFRKISPNLLISIKLMVLACRLEQNILLEDTHGGLSK